MELKDFLLYEFKDFTQSSFVFWADDLNNFLVDINDKEEVSAYIKRKSKLLNNEYSSKLNGKKIENFSIRNIINILDWKHIVLKGRRNEVELAKSERNKEPKKYITNVYTEATVTISDLISQDGRKEIPSILEITDKLKELYPTIKRVAIIDRKNKKKEIYLKDKKPKKRKFKPWKAK